MDLDRAYGYVFINILKGALGCSKVAMMFYAVILARKSLHNTKYNTQSADQTSQWNHTPSSPSRSSTSSFNQVSRWSASKIYSGIHLPPWCVNSVMVNTWDYGTCIIMACYSHGLFFFLPLSCSHSFIYMENMGLITASSFSGGVDCESFLLLSSVCYVAKLGGGFAGEGNVNYYGWIYRGNLQQSKWLFKSFLWLVELLFRSRRLCIAAMWWHCCSVITIFCIYSIYWEMAFSW